MTLNNLGVLLKNLGYIEEAKQRYEKALEINENLLKTYPENISYQESVAGFLNNLGRLLSAEKENWVDAKEKHEKALYMRRKLLETDIRNILYQSHLGTTLNDLGSLLLKMGYAKEAKLKYEEALEIYTQPMHHITIKTKARTILELIKMNSELAKKEEDFVDQMGHLKEAYRLCEENQDFFSRYDLKYERELATGEGLLAYIDYSIRSIRGLPSIKRLETYEKAISAVEKLNSIGANETISRFSFSAICYLRGRKLVNEAIISGEPDLKLVKQAVEQFKEAKESLDKANVCYCIYLGLLSIWENFDKVKEINISETKNIVDKVLNTLPKDIDPSIKASFEEIPFIFEEKDGKSRMQLLKELERKVSAIEYKALENIFGQVHKKLEDYFEEPYSPIKLIYENWKLKIIFDDPEKVKGKLTIKAGNKSLFNRLLTAEEIKNNLIEIDYLREKYIPKSEDEISFSTPGQKNSVVRQIDYFETINRDKKIQILLNDFSDTVRIGKNVRIAAVQLKYHAYEENSIVKITADDAYEKKVMSILEAVKGKTDIVVFPEFSIPFDYLGKMQKYADENGIIVVAGSHYVSDKNLGEYGKLFSRDFEENDLRKNISPIIIPSLKIVHNEKFLGAREERPIFFDKGMEIGKINNIFRLKERLNIGVMICYEFLNSELRHRLLPTCDIILVPQTNPKPQSFYKEAENEINRPVGGGTKVFVMANGIFTIENKKEVTGGSTGIYLTLDKYSNEKKDQAVITPIDEVMEQFILIASIDTDFYPAWDTQTGQEPIILKLVHIFEEAEILSKSKEKGKEFIELIEKINSCDERNKLKSMLTKERGSIEKKTDDTETSLIKQFSPLMNKCIQDLDELKLEELKEKCIFLVIPNNQNQFQK